jgi:hypothetical protein
MRRAHGERAKKEEPKAGVSGKNLTGFGLR